MRRVSTINQLTSTSGGTYLLITNARIEESVEQINAEIDAHKKRRRDKHRGLHNGIIAVVNPLDGQTAYARPRKNRLRDHGPTQERAKLQAHDGDDWNGG